MTYRFKYIIPVLLSLFILSPLSAQKTRSKKKVTKPTKTIDFADIQNLIKAYRFEEAEDLITEELDRQDLTVPNDPKLEKALKQARLGSEMLLNTEKVIIVDSLVVKRSDFLKQFKLSEECGEIMPSNAIALPVKEKRIGATAYINELGDRCIYSVSDNAEGLQLVSTDRLGTEWSSPKRLNNIGQPTDIQDYPFMMTDGVTLYFAAQSEESLGGYDIFVTRYNKSTGEFMKAENMGMPFNSPANDYLMAIDETCNIGWFVTDRNQTHDNVCIYRFIPNETREVYEFSPENEEKIRRMAQINSIAESQTNKDAVRLARERISKIGTSSDGTSKEEHRFIINDQKVYNNLSQFKSSKAKDLAIKLVIYYGQLQSKNQALDTMRSQFAQQPTEQLKKDILKIEKEVATLRQDIEKEENDMRQAELHDKR